MLDYVVISVKLTVHLQTQMFRLMKCQIKMKICKRDQTERESNNPAEFCYYPYNLKTASWKSPGLVKQSYIKILIVS